MRSLILINFTFDAIFVAILLFRRVNDGSFSFCSTLQCFCQRVPHFRGFEFLCVIFWNVPSFEGFKLKFLK